MRLRAVLLLACAVRAAAQTPVPEELKKVLIGLRGHAAEHWQTRGATPEFARVKLLVRDWIESRLTPLPRDGEETALAIRLNQELADAGASCGECRSEDLTGFLGDIEIRRSGLLVVQTRLGINCGFDESAYAYHWIQNRWSRVWQTEQTAYTDQGYKPQLLRVVAISPDYGPEGEESAHVFVTLETNPWCSSNWQSVYYRVWQARAGNTPKLLLDEQDYGFTEDPFQVSVSAEDLLIEYSVGGMDGFMRRLVRHYQVGRRTLERVDPVALGPRDFVQMMIETPPKVVLNRTPAAVRIALDHWRRRFGKAFDLMDPTNHCRLSPDLWQVGTRVASARVERPAGYFIIRWRPPYRFSLADLRATPRADCTEEDPAADEPRTLFPAGNTIDPLL